MRKSPRKLGLFSAKVAALALLASLASGVGVRANAINPNDILVSETGPASPGGVIYEYTRAGNLVQEFSVPPAPGGDNPLRSIAVDGNGRIEAFNGTLAPYLTTITPTAGSGNATYQNHTVAGWITIPNIQYGGIAYDPTRNVVYVTNEGNPNGIVQFDLNHNFAASRFAQGVQYGSGDYTDLTLGANGLLYAIYPPVSPGENQVDVIDPKTGHILRTVDLPLDYNRGIAVDAAGNIYTDGFSDGKIYRLNSSGQITGFLDTGRSHLHGLRLSNDGVLAALDSNNNVILTTTSLSTWTSFAAGIPAAFQSYVAFGSPLQVVPEPSSLALVLIGTFGAFVCVRRRGLA